MAGLNDRYEVPGMEERKTASKKPATIDRTSMHRLEKALLPYEKKLRRQERFRRILGVKEVERPTYRRYLTGSVERFDKNRMAFLCMRPDNPFGEDLRRKFKERTGYDHYLSPLPYEELDYEDRIGRAILKPSWLNLRFFPRVDNRHSRMLKIKLISGDKTIIPLKCNRSDD